MNILKTARTSEKGIVSINHENCKACGQCVEVCKAFAIEQNSDKKPIISENPLYACIGCGHCEAVCKSEAIFVVGRTLEKDDFFELDYKNIADFEQLNNLISSRRSIREFKNKEIPQDVIDKIINSSSFAPMGIPPSDVNLLVLQGKDNVKEFSYDVIDEMKKKKWISSPFVLPFIKIFTSNNFIEFLKLFLKPLIEFMVKKKEKEDKNYLLYDAPLAIYYYLSSDTADPADPMIPATYSMLVAQSLGLGTTMIGSVTPIIQYGAKELKNKYRLPKKIEQGIVVIYGYPKYKYKKGIKRSFAKVDFWKKLIE